MHESSSDDSGLFARILRQRNIWLAIALIMVFSAVVLYLNMQTEAPKFELEGAASDLAQEAAAGIVVLLLGFLIAHLFLGHDREILSRAEVDRIAAKVADHAARVVGTPPLDRTLLDNRDNAHILGEAEREVCISRETGNRLFGDCNALIQKLLKDGCRFKIVLADPASRGAEHAKFRLSNSGKADLQSRQRNARGLLNQIYANDRSAQRRIELRYTAFALPATTIITDPNRLGRRSEVLYRHIGHLITGDAERFSLRLDSETSPRAAKVITQEFYRIFHSASKTVVLPYDERLTTFGLTELFPRFFPRDHCPARPDGQGEPFVAMASSESIFLIAFDAEGSPGETPYNVRFGPANKLGSSKAYATPEGGKWKISFDSLMELRAAYDHAVSQGCAIMIANLGPVALGMRQACAVIEVSEADLRSSPPDNLEFFLANRDPATGRMPLSLTPAIEPLLEDIRAHLYLHFQNLDLTCGNAFHRAVLDHERTTMLDPLALLHDLPLELQGSAKAVTFGAAAPVA